MEGLILVLILILFVLVLGLFVGALAADKQRKKDATIFTRVQNKHPKLNAASHYWFLKKGTVKALFTDKEINDAIERAGSNVEDYEHLI
jgi:uncharacterized protein YneF (UPF0154 family)